MAVLYKILLLLLFLLAQLPPYLSAHLLLYRYSYSLFNTNSDDSISILPEIRPSQGYPALVPSSKESARSTSCDFIDYFSSFASAIYIGEEKNEEGEG